MITSHSLPPLIYRIEMFSWWNDWNGQCAFMISQYIFLDAFYTWIISMHETGKIWLFFLSLFKSLPLGSSPFLFVYSLGACWMHDSKYVRLEKKSVQIISLPIKYFCRQKAECKSTFAVLISSTTYIISIKQFSEPWTYRTKLEWSPYIEIFLFSPTHVNIKSMRR